MMNGKDSSSLNLLYLPDDLLLNCLARVSRLYYPTLSLVSKRFRSLVVSTEIYEFRKLLGCTESCLYACLSFPHDVKPRWFTLCRIPNPKPSPNPNPKRRWYTQCFTPCFRQKITLTNHTKKKEKKQTIENRLVTVPTLNYSLDLRWWTLTTIGSSIYLIGGFINDEPSSRVLFMDCRSHTWREAPSMRVARNFSEASILDGKIYVVGGIGDWDSSNMIECFDPKTQKWEDVPSPAGLEIRGPSNSENLAIEGKLYLFGKDKNVAYKPKENRWDAVELEMFLGWHPDDSSCVIDNVLYSYGMSDRLQWYDLEARIWRVLEGVEELPNCYSEVELVDYGGKIVVLWEDHVGGLYSNEKNIWCAEIAIKRHNEHKICGKIEWCDVVLRVSEPSSFEFVAVTV